MAERLASAELDAEVARRVFGGLGYRSYRLDDVNYRLPLLYSTQIDVAWLVVGELIERGWAFTLRSDALGEPGVGWRAYFRRSDEGYGPIASGDGATAQEAICRAALDLMAGIEAN